MHRGVHPGEPLCAVWCGRHGRRRRDVRVDERLGSSLVAERAGQGADVSGIRDPLDVRRDLGVGGRDDLRAVVGAAEVHLVPVVVRRVVTRGHHDAGIRPQLAHREREHGRRQQPREEDRAQPGAGEDLGGVLREHVGVATAVVPDHHGRHAGLTRGALAHERGEPGCGLRHEHPVHTVAARAEFAAQAGRAECEAPGEPVRELGGRRRHRPARRAR